MNYLIEHKELAICSLIVGLFLPMVVRKIYSTFCWCGEKAVAFFDNPYGTGILTAILVAGQFFWLQQWIFAYNEVTQHDRTTGSYTRRSRWRFRCSSRTSRSSSWRHFGRSAQSTRESDESHRPLRR